MSRSWWFCARLVPTVRMDSNVFPSFVLVLSHGRVALVILHAGIDVFPLFFSLQFFKYRYILMKHSRNSCLSWACEGILIRFVDWLWLSSRSRVASPFVWFEARSIVTNLLCCRRYFVRLFAFCFSCYPRMPAQVGSSRWSPYQNLVGSEKVVDTFIEKSFVWRAVA